MEEIKIDGSWFMYPNIKPEETGLLAVKIERVLSEGIICSVHKGEYNPVMNAFYVNGSWIKRDNSTKKVIAWARLAER